MKEFVLLTAFLCAFYLNGFNQKVVGPILKNELVGKYVGGLKNGLAQGKGTAIGQDSYTGNFRKGLPDGEGIYTDNEGNVYKGAFMNGLKDGKGELNLILPGKDSLLKGSWEKDKFIGLGKGYPYEISNKTGIVIPRIFNTGPGNKVEITIVDPVTNMLITGSIAVKGEGTLRTTFGRYIYEDVVFPIEFDIRYDCNNKIGTSTASNTIRIKLNRPASWVVTLNN
jgi:hypothetical protein